MVYISELIVILDTHYKNSQPPSNYDQCITRAKDYLIASCSNAVGTVENTLFPADVYQFSQFMSIFSHIKRASLSLQTSNNYYSHEPDVLSILFKKIYPDTIISNSSKTNEALHYLENSKWFSKNGGWQLFYQNKPFKILCETFVLIPNDNISQRLDKLLQTIYAAPNKADWLSIVLKRPTLHQYLLALSFLSRVNLENNETIAPYVYQSSCPQELASILCFLSRKNIPIEPLIARIANHPNMDDLNTAFSSLSYPELLMTDQNINAVLDDPLPTRRVEVIRTLNEDAYNSVRQARVIKNINLDQRLYQHETPLILMQAFSALKKSSILTDQYIALVSTHKNPCSLANALCTLKRKGYLTDDMIKLVLEHNDPASMATGLINLKQSAFYDEALIPLLTQHEHPSELVIAFQILNQQTNLNQLTIQYVNQHQSAPVKMATGLCRLKTDHLDTIEYISDLVNHASPDDLAKALCTLQAENLLNIQHLPLIVSCDAASDMAESLCLLKNNHLFAYKVQLLPTEPSGIFITQHRDTLYLYRKNESIWYAVFDKNGNIIRTVQEDKVQDQINNAFIENRPLSPEETAVVLKAIPVNHRPQPDLCITLLAQKVSGPLSLIKAFITFSKANLLVSEYMELIFTKYCSERTNWANALVKFHRLSKLKHLLLSSADIQDPFFISKINAMAILHGKKLLKEPVVAMQCMDFVRNYASASAECQENAARFLCTLSEHALLTPENLALLKQRITDSYTLRQFHNTLIQINESNLLTQNNFNALLNPAYSIYWNSDCYQNNGINSCLERIPSHLLTQAVLNDLLTLTINHNAVNFEQTVLAFCQQLLGQVPIPNAVAGIAENDYYNGQSTHTASVHTSVAVSLQRLDEHFLLTPENIDACEQAFFGFKNAIMTYSDRIGHDDCKAASHSMDRLRRLSLNGQEEQTKFTLRKIIALVWSAIKEHPTSHTNGLDAKESLIRQLRNIQREYNDDAHTGRDQPSCWGGTINALVAAVNGIHPDVTLVLLNKTAIVAQLHAVAKQLFLKDFKQKSHGNEQFTLDIQHEIENDEWESDVLKQLYEDILQAVIQQVTKDTESKLQAAHFSPSQVIEQIKIVDQYMQAALPALREFKPMLSCIDDIQKDTSNKKRPQDTDREEDHDDEQRHRPHPRVSLRKRLDTLIEHALKTSNEQLKGSSILAASSRLFAPTSRVDVEKINQIRAHLADLNMQKIEEWLDEIPKELTQGVFGRALSDAIANERQFTLEQFLIELLDELDVEARVMAAPGSSSAVRP